MARTNPLPKQAAPPTDPVHLPPADTPAGNQDLTRRLDQLALLNDIARSAASSLKISDMLDKLADSLIERARFDRCLLLVAAVEGERYEGLVASQDGRFRLTLGDLNLGRHGSPTPQEMTALLSEHPVTGQMMEPRTLVVIPLFVRDRVVGLLGVDNHRHQRPFEPDEVAFVSAIAAQIEIAVDNARLYESMKYSALGFMHLFEVASAFNSTLDYRQAVQVIVGKMAYCLAVSHCTLVTIDKHGQVRLEGSTDPDAEIGRTLVLNDLPPLQQAMVSRRPVTFNAAQQGGQPCLSLSSALIVPLYLRNRLIGFLALGETETDQSRSFTARETQLAQTIANQASITLENAQLYQELEERVVERTIELRQANYDLQARQKELELLTQQLRAIIHSIPDGIVVLDPQQRVVISNPAFGHLFRLKAYPEPGVTVAQLMQLVRDDRDNRATIDNLFQTLVVDPDEAKQVELMLEQAPRRAFKVLTAPVIDVTGEGRGQVLVFHDVTRERELDQMKSDFVATVSHELRTPVAAMIGFATLLEDGIGGPVSSAQQEYLDKILAQGERLIRLINDLLDLSKLEAGQMSVFPQLFHVDEVMREVVEQLRPLVEEKRLQIELEIAPDLPPVEVDPDRFYQILTNLIGNAIKFSPEDRGRIQLSAWRYSPHEIAISVADNGIGIDPESQPHLFDSFYQADQSATRKYGGAGLGLAIVKKLVELHHGRIWAESVLGEGSTFTFTMPLPPELRQ